ncbi:MAG: multiubiquitin domain-containing protein [Gammaproteobacteria bacterium]
MTQEDSSQSGSGPGHNKTYSIIVNGRPRTVTDDKLTYIQAIHLAFPGEQPSESVSFTVTYSNPHGKDGSLVEGQETKVHDGMILNVRKTDRS